jgi:hypothetical protein
VGYLKNTPLVLKAFHNVNREAPGPLRRLYEWIKAVKEDCFD